MESKSKVVDKVDAKVKTLSNKTSSKFHMTVLQQNNPLYILNDIRNQFLATTLDKANENVAFICQQIYAIRLFS